jgi:hypothetical protein
LGPKPLACISFPRGPAPDITTFTILFQTMKSPEASAGDVLNLLDIMDTLAIQWDHVFVYTLLEVCFCVA